MNWGRVECEVCTFNLHVVVLVAARVVQLPFREAIEIALCAAILVENAQALQNLREFVVR